MDNLVTNNREQWLINATDLLREGLFKSEGYTVPAVKVSVGFPGGGSARKRIGEYWSPKASVDNKGSVFISPILDDASEVLGTLVHELVHATVGTEHGHGPVFKKCALAVGLTGKMKSTTETAELKAKLKTMVETQLGIYPHGKLNLKDRPTKKQSTRMIKMECEPCGYIARTARANIIQHGPCICPSCGNQMTV